MLGLLIGAVALGGGFVGARDFVRRRLRFVDAVLRPSAPLVAGLAATAVVLPIAALPIITVGTAVAFGVGVAGGVVSGRREARNARTALFANVLPAPFSTSSRALHLGKAGRTGVAICRVSNASATARIFTVVGSGSASISQSSPTIS